MAVSKEDILETLSNMTVMEVVDLIAAMEEKFGVSAAAAVAAAPAAAGDGGAGLKLPKATDRQSTDKEASTNTYHPQR